MTQDEDKPTAAAAAAPKQRSESDVYDRQIRLWGADSQAKMSKAKVLYVHVTGVSNEILKNLVLAGIRPVLYDPRKLETVATTPSFFLACPDAPDTEDENNKQPENTKQDDNPAKKKKLKPPDTVAEAMKPAVEQLNPLLGDCPVVIKALDDWTVEFIQSLEVTCVVASGLSKAQALKLANLVKTANEKAAAKTTESATTSLWVVDTFGMYGVCILDLGPEHSYRPEKGKKLLDVTTLSPYYPLQTILTTPLAELPKNRFFKVGVPAPVPWIYYQCLLQYLEGEMESDDDKVQGDFVEKTRQWIQSSSSASVLDQGDVFSQDSLASLARQCFLKGQTSNGSIASRASELAAVCSVLGGLVGNEIIKAISGKGEPANNTLVFDGTLCKSWTFLVQSKADKEAADAAKKKG